MKRRIRLNVVCIRRYTPLDSMFSISKDPELEDTVYVDLECAYENILECSQDCPLSFLNAI